MSYRAAFASSDGIVINQHFGRAEAFLIMDIDDERKVASFEETRKHPPVCSGGSHDERQMEKLTELLSDCRIVFAAKIGEGAREILQKKGIQGISAPYTIEEVIHELLYSDVKIIQEITS